MRPVGRALTFAGPLLLALTLSSVAGADTPTPSASGVTVTVTPQVLVLTDSQGRAVSTVTQLPTPTPTGPLTVTVTATPDNPGLRNLGQNDGGQWIGMLIGLVLGTLTTVAVITRRRVRTEVPVAFEQSAEHAESEKPGDAREPEETKDPR